MFLRFFYLSCNAGFTASFVSAGTENIGCVFVFFPLPCSGFVYVKIYLFIILIKSKNIKHLRHSNGDGRVWLRVVCCVVYVPLRCCLLLVLVKARVDARDMNISKALVFGFFNNILVRF